MNAAAGQMCSEEAGQNKYFPLKVLIHGEYSCKPIRDRSEK